jgi:hypothetical protein
VSKLRRGVKTSVMLVPVPALPQNLEAARKNITIRVKVAGLSESMLFQIRNSGNTPDNQLCRCQQQEICHP